MPSNEIETNDVNGSWLTEQEPLSGRCSRQANIGCHHVNPVISKRRKWTTQENKIVWSAIYWVSPRLEGIESACWVYGHKNVCFWVSEQRLVDQANTICRNSWMTRSDSIIVEEARSVEALPDHVLEDVRNVLPEMGAEEQVDSLKEEEVTIVMEIDKEL